MAESNGLNPDLLEQIVEFLRFLENGQVKQTLPISSAQNPHELFLVDYLNRHSQNLQETLACFNHIQSEVEQLVDGIQDVLQTIEKATIRVLDNTDGVLEQHDTIEKTNEYLKQNAALYRIFGARMDKIHQSQSKARMFIFDIIQAQEFQEMTRKQTEQLVGVLEALKTQLFDLKTRLRIDHHPVEAPPSEASPSSEAEPAKASQDLVDQLLAEFGL